jgi:integrase
MFLDFAKVDGSDLRERCNVFATRAKKDVMWCEELVYRYLSYLKEQYEKEKKISAGTIKNRKVVVKSLLEILKIPFDWKLVSRGLPKPERYSSDRTPYLSEIRKICEYNDRRVKPIVYAMCSGGIRIGAWDYLKWKHIVPIKRNGQVVAALMEVYAGTDSQYPTLVTKECYESLLSWMNFRKESGEKITGESWLMRQYWDTKEGFTHGNIKNPLKLSKEGVKGLLDSAMRRQGLRKNLANGKKRHEFMLNHSFRKWRETQLILAGLKQQDINILMGHKNSGMVDIYYRPWVNGEQKIDDYLVNEFLRASNMLSIQDEYRLNEKVELLEEKEKEIEGLKEQQLDSAEAIATLSDRLSKALEDIEILKHKK